MKEYYSALRACGLTDTQATQLALQCDSCYAIGLGVATLLARSGHGYSRDKKVDFNRLVSTYESNRDNQHRVLLDMEAFLPKGTKLEYARRGNHLGVFEVQFVEPIEATTYRMKNMATGKEHKITLFKLIEMYRGSKLRVVP